MTTEKEPIVASMQPFVSTHFCVVNVSGGVPSAIALERAIQVFGRKRTIGVFADVKIEDPDLYRFLEDVEFYLEFPITRIAEGRTPWEVFFDEGMMGSNRADLCSRILKREFIDKWLINNGYTPENTVRAFGFGIKELTRSDNIKQVVAPYKVWLPLHDRPFMASCDCVDYVRNVWNIDPPDLYDQGFPHNNCGGACVKAGHGQWYLCYRKRRRVYDTWEQHEEAFRFKTGKDVSILRDRRGGSYKPLTLRELRRRFEEDGYRPSDTSGGCDCMGLSLVTMTPPPLSC